MVRSISELRTRAIQFHAHSRKLHVILVTNLRQLRIQSSRSGPEIEPTLFIKEAKTATISIDG